MIALATPTASASAVGDADGDGDATRGFCVIEKNPGEPHVGSKS